MIRALVVTHGDLGRELTRVAEKILGPVPGLESLSNRGLSALELTAEIRTWLASVSRAEAEAILLVDDFGGSCASAARLALEGMPRVPVLCGVNLAMLLGFAAWREATGLEELAQKLVDKGRAAITRAGTAEGRSGDLGPTA